MGKLIVLEGIDGSGKSTQTSLLCERLKRENVDFRRVTFPRYDSPSSAPLRMYLGGEMGDKPGDVNAYAASSFFAVDRYISYKTEWGAYYDNGGLIICDRYTTSNAIHQGAKLPPDELAPYLDWLYDFEFTKLGLPKPDLVLYLHIGADDAIARLAARETGADIHERDAEYLRRCAETAHAASLRLQWKNVSARGETRDIHEQIYALIQEIIA